MMRPSQCRVPRDGSQASAPWSCDRVGGLPRYQVVWASHSLLYGEYTPCYAPSPKAPAGGRQAGAGVCKDHARLAPDILPSTWLKLFAVKWMNSARAGT